MPRGGKREGAGRKRDLAGQAIVNQAIDARLPDIIMAQIDAALGEYFEEKLPDGSRRVYKARPSNQGLDSLLNRRLGKPVEMTQLSDATTDRLVRVIVEEIRSQSKVPD